MQTFVRSLMVAGTLAGASVLGIGAASAMPIAPGSGVATATAPIQPVVFPCGPGWHPNPWGRCVPFHPYYGGRYFYGGRYWAHPYGWRHPYGWHGHYWHRRYY